MGSEPNERSPFQPENEHGQSDRSTHRREYWRPAAAASLQALLTDMPIDFVAPTTQHAFIAARVRQRFPLNLGDCFVYALAVTENLPILTLDTDFLGVDVPVILPPGQAH